MVVPVGRQIAHRLKSYVAPGDGTPFGGYKGGFLNVQATQGFRRMGRRSTRPG